ncbi:MAG: flavin reductase family protein [Methanosphaera sp.]
MKHKTVENLKLKQEFTISFATKDTEVLSDYFGVRSANDADKIKESDVSVVKAEKVDAPIIEEYPLTIEFKVVEMEEKLGELRVVGEAVNVSADESILDSEGNISIKKL